MNSNELYPLYENCFTKISGQQHNFHLYSPSSTTHYGQPYDYGSLMHYGRYDFAKDDNVWTIRARAPLQNTPLGQSVGLSNTDILKMNALYPAIASTK